MKRTLFVMFVAILSVFTLFVGSVESQELAEKLNPVYLEDANDDAETKLLKERVRAVWEETQFVSTRVKTGNERLLNLLNTRKRLIAAQLDFHKQRDEIISLLEKNVSVAKAIETAVQQRVASGIEQPDKHAQAKFFRADAELQLLRANRKFAVDRDEK